MAHLNTNFGLLAAGYLFPEVSRRCNAWQEKHPGVELLKLGIGNTTEALPPALVAAMKHKLDLLSDRATYTGYGDEQGDTSLRLALREMYTDRYGVELEETEFFVSDGAKSDAANIQELFAKDAIVAVADPAYPVYVDSNVVGGRSGVYDKAIGGYSNFVYLPCNVENGFIPQVPDCHVDLIYLCSPNNPTGAVMTKVQMKQFVDYARREKAVIIFDGAYSEYISNQELPHTIFEIEGSQECAIEINSFSKSAGFTGVRLGWSIVPKALVVEDSVPGQLNGMWNRRQCTFFNGASNIAQAGGLAALKGEGLAQCQALVGYYLENARIIREGLESVGLVCFGGDNSPYIWARTPNEMDSWAFFDYLLDTCHVVVTPGGGFGPSGEHYVRVSSYGHQENVKKAIASIKEHME
ncbi:MAG: LL-diaminopimelate aminotransferase [Spirochaetia bacterium]|jgi:LL-diaminopimelate aminotransferase|nr:LL-diaminopimelate aminotransferase [Spirochaetia bacterium]